MEQAVVVAAPVVDALAQVVPVKEMDAVQEVLGQLAFKYPGVMSALLLVGAFRFFFKPVMSLIQHYVRFTKTPNDDALLAKILGSKAYLAVVWVVDYLASVKLPKLPAAPVDKK